MLPLFPGAAAARADLRAGRSLHAAGLPAAARRAGARDRSGDAASAAGAATTGGSPAAIGVVFVAAFVAVQWPFADFLMTPWARNWFFVSRSHGLRRRPGVPGALVPAAIRPTTWRVGLPIALVLGVRLGALRAVVGQLDGARAAMSRWWRPLARRLQARLRSASAVRWRTSAAPTRSSAARPAPISVRVSVRLPGVIPGRAQVAVRVAGATPAAEVYHVTVRAGQWNVGLEGAPPPEPRRAGPGRSRRCTPPSSGS